MPEYLSPGVYIEEAATGTVPIQGVATSNGGFLGRTERGPVETRQVNSFAEYKRLYGGFGHYKAGGRLESTYLAYGVEGFFRNGGSRAVVGRVVPEDTPTASTNLPNGEPPAGTPRPALSTDVVDFGTVTTGETDGPINVEVTNPADGEEIPTDAIEVSVRDANRPGDFRAERTGSGPLAAGNTTTVEVTFTPEAAAVGRERSATLVVAYSDRDELTAEIVGDVPEPDAGIGTDALVGEPAEVTIGGSTAINVALTNRTGGDLSDTEITLEVGGEDVADFSAPTGVAIAADATETVAVTFEPQPGPETERTAELAVELSGEPQFSVHLHGEVTPALVPATGDVSFGTIPPGGSSVRRVEFTNEGAADVELTDIDEPYVTGEGADDFTVTLEADATTVPGSGGTLTAVVEFMPNVADTRTVTLALATPAGEPAGTVTLTANTGPITVEAIGPGVWGRNVAVIVTYPEPIDPANPVITSFDLTLRYWAEDAAVESAILHGADPDHSDVPRPDHEEVFPNLSPDESSPEYYIEVVNAASTLVRLEREAPGMPASGGPFWLSATFTEDEANEVGLALSDFIGIDRPGELTGFHALAAEDEVAIVCVPDQYSVPGLTDEILTHCETLGDRFAVLQTDRNAGLVNTIRPPGTSEYAAIYYPWIEVVDPETNVRKTVPPGGHVAGVYARTDQERGVHKAPANAILRGAQALKPDVTRGDQDTLNPRNVNCIRSFPGRGIRVYGARTMASNAQWRYVNVRRLFNFVEESVEESTQWVVFEPNDEKLWARVRQSVSDFLTTVWRDGALAGSTAEEAFFVNVDRTTMTQAEIDQGKLIVEIGLAPVKPAEFVIFRFSQKTAEAEA